MRVPRLEAPITFQIPFCCMAFFEWTKVNLRLLCHLAKYSYQWVGRIEVSVWFSPPHSLSNEMRRLCGWIPYTPTKKVSVNDILTKQLKSIPQVLRRCAAGRAYSTLEQDYPEEVVLMNSPNYYFQNRFPIVNISWEIVSPCVSNWRPAKTPRQKLFFNV